MWSVLTRNPDFRRLFISQLVLFGRKPVEVAAELKIKTGAVYAIKSRIIQRLKEEFRGLIDL